MPKTKTAFEAHWEKSYSSEHWELLDKKLMQIIRDEAKYNFEECVRLKEKEISELKEKLKIAEEIIRTDESRLRGVQYAIHYKRKLDFVESISNLKD